MDSVAHLLSLSGQDECVMDTSSSSLSLAGAEKKTPPMMGHDIMMNYYNSLSDDEKTKLHEESLKANPRASAQELIEDKRATLWKAIHTAKVERKSQDENELYVRGPAQKALLKEFRLSLTQAQTGEMYGKLREDYPDANAEELAMNLRAVMVTAAIEARRKKIQDEKNPSFPPSVPAGTFRPASPLSLHAQPKSDTPSKVNSRPLSLTTEERKHVFE